MACEAGVLSKISNDAGAALTGLVVEAGDAMDPNRSTMPLLLKGSGALPVFCRLTETGTVLPGLEGDNTVVGEDMDMDASPKRSNEGAFEVEVDPKISNEPEPVFCLLTDPADPDGGGIIPNPLPVFWRLKFPEPPGGGGIAPTPIPLLVPVFCRLTVGEGQPLPVPLAESTRLCVLE